MGLFSIRVIFNQLPDKFAANYPWQPSLIKTLAKIGAGAACNWWRGHE